jgi:predicted Zn-dependent peptidase
MKMKENFKRLVLDNGMTIVFEKRDVPVVSIALAVRNGGINEKESEKGISHYIEHMLYKGTPTRNAFKIAQEIEKNGGELNGFTSEEITAYWCKMPSKNADIGLEVLTDMVKNPLFDKEELEKERKVIFEEIKMRRDSPRTYTFDKIQEFLYGGTLGKGLIGTKETMNSIGREDLLKKFKEIYTPNNLILSVVGDYDFDKLVEFAKKNFGNEKGKVPSFEIKLKNEVKIETRKGIDQANLVFAFHAPLAEDGLSPAAEVLITSLAGGMSSRLFSEIREKRNLAYAVKGDASISKDYSYLLIYVGTTKENVSKVKELILEEFQKVSNGLEEKELNEVKKQLIGNHQISMEDSQTQMVNLLLHEIEGDASKFYDHDEKISGVKLEEVKKLASEVVEGKYSFFALVPEDK